MSRNRLIEKLNKDRPVLGLVSMYPAAGIIEGMCRGWDFVMVDGQHGQYSYDSVLQASRAAAGIGVDTMIRVPDDQYGTLGSYADMAPASIMVPMVNSVAQGKRIVDSLRFPPLGKRSFGGRRIIDLNGRDCHRNCALMIVAQIETDEGLRNASSIAAVEGIGALFFSPDDMKLSLGISIDTPVARSLRLRRSMSDVATAARSAGKVCGCIAADPEVFKLALEMHYRILLSGSDAGFLRQAAAGRLKELRSPGDKDA